MDRIDCVFGELFVRNPKPCRKTASTLKFNECLRLFRLCSLFLTGVLIATRCPECTAGTVFKVLEGETAILNCTNTSLFGPTSFKWFRNDGGLLPPDIQKNTSSLVLPNIIRNSSTTYICSYTINGSSSVYNESIKLIVQYPPKVTSVLPSSTVQLKPGQNISLSCVVDAVPSVNKIIWTKNNIHVYTDFYQENTNISISNAKCSDAGEYQCFPSNVVGPASQNGTMKVHVQDKPGQVQILRTTSTSTTITISWQHSSKSCLPLEYVIEWIKTVNSFNHTKNVQSNHSVTLNELAPYQAYGVFVWAKNTEGSGPFVMMKIVTKIGAPSSPLAVTATSKLGCDHTLTVYVNWTKPLQVNGPNTDLYYQVYYQEENSTYWNYTTHTPWTNYTITGRHLIKGGIYLVKVQACNNCTSSCSKYSNVTTITVEKRYVDCDRVSDSDTGLGGGAIAAIVIVIIIIIVCIVLFIYFRNRPCCRMPLKGLFTLEQPSTSSLTRLTSYKERRDREAVPYERFWNHIILRHADTNYRFSSEFESVQAIHQKNKKLSWIHSQRPENQPKNRFANVVAYDQSRVVLSMIDNVPGSHYINANYVDSYNAMNFYIATQGPLANTIADFWRMVWEQNSTVIVMITNIQEKGRHKCSQYWPTKNRKVQDHGQLRVTFLREEHFAFYTHREFEIKPVKESTHYCQFKKGSSSLMNGRTWDASDEAIKPMLVQQFHFTGWPDHGVLDPGYELSVLDFIFRSTAAQVEGVGPMVVHCSAGVGRSGAYIVIDSMVKRIHDNGDIDIFNFLLHIRQQRNHLVQEECQYIFVHDVILEYIQCGFLLSLPKKALKEHVYKLRTLTQPFGKKKITQEFEKLKSIKIQDYNLKEVSKVCNTNKHRNTTIKPVDTCRVKLYPRPGEEGSDYINASYIDGFWRREAYIATQYPLESTIFDFWRMMWQENCRTIVMLISKEELDKDEYPRYLPVVHDTARFGVYEVTMETESARGDLMIRDLRMNSLNEPGETRRIRHFHFLHWPENGLPWSGQSILQLVSKVDEWEKDVKSKSKPFDMIGPMVVHCSTGAGRTGVYCILHTLWHQVVREEVVSVYPYTRLYFHQRPQFLQTQDQYEFCYDTMVEYIDADCSLYLV